MKKYNNISIFLANKRFRRKLKSKNKRLDKRQESFEAHLLSLIENNQQEFSISDVIEYYLPPNIRFLLNCDASDFHIEKLKAFVPENNGNFLVPKEFSIVDYPKESYQFIRDVTAALITQKYSIVNIDYSICERADLGAQVFLDIILKDIFEYFDKVRLVSPRKIKVRSTNGTNFNNKDIKKMLFSVGSPAIHSKGHRYFSDIIPYKLCIHDRDSHKDPLKIIEQKDIDTTTLVDYVIQCLGRLNKKLSPEKIDDLSIVISEILINAEEHSTTKFRFSIGYFHEILENGKHYGVFRLAILNFGKTIYEKFKDPCCPNKEIVTKMELLSQKYMKKKFFFKRQFEEETLWTLYALQEGVTTIAPEKYRKRGHGSIQFIESFFNLKGNNESDDVSRLAIMSGNASIVFDGKYNIFEKETDGEVFKYMTFNNSKNIEDAPDHQYVKYVDNYFPGTIISAKIIFNEDDYESKA